MCDADQLILSSSRLNHFINLQRKMLTEDQWSEMENERKWVNSTLEFIQILNSSEFNKRSVNFPLIGPIYKYKRNYHVIHMQKIT